MHIRKPTKKVIIIIIMITIVIPITQIYNNSNSKSNSILYYLCAEPTATRPITGTAQCRYR
jgi:hypothetical protein